MLKRRIERKIISFMSREGISDRESFNAQYSKGFELFDIIEPMPYEEDFEELTALADKKQIALMISIDDYEFHSFRQDQYGEMENVGMTESSLKMKKGVVQDFEQYGFEHVIHSTWIRYPK